MGKKKVILVTLHRKGDQIIPAFESVKELEVFEFALNTDGFGTFAGDIERRLSPLENAIAKAREGIRVSGIRRAIASEGSIGPDPQVPLVNSDHEVIVYVDDEEGVVISESHRSFEIVALSEEITIDTPLQPLLKRADFPHHKVILKAKTASGLVVRKDLLSIEAVLSAVQELCSTALDGVVTIESDLRAHASPSRQRNIQIAAQLLAKRVVALCPLCQRRGWGRVEHKRGVPCSECLRINDDVASHVINGCAGCGHRELGEVIREQIDPAQCNYCNP